MLEHYRQPVSVEEFIAGDEVTVGVIGNISPRVLGIMRILPRRKVDYFVYSLEVKRDYLNLVEYESPAILEDRVQEEISAASLEQNTGAEQVNHAIQQLNSATQANAAASEELATSSEELAGQADQLKELMSFFRL